MGAFWEEGMREMVNKELIKQIELSQKFLIIKDWLIDISKVYKIRIEEYTEEESPCGEIILFYLSNNGDDIHIKIAYSKTRFFGDIWLNHEEFIKVKDYFLNKIGKKKII